MNPPTILPAAAVELAILHALPGRVAECEAVYAACNREHPELSFGQFWECLMALDRRGLVVTNAIDGKGDAPPRVSVAHPHLDRPVR